MLRILRNRMLRINRHEEYFTPHRPGALIAAHIDAYFEPKLHLMTGGMKDESQMEFKSVAGVIFLLLKVKPPPKDTSTWPMGRKFAHQSHSLSLSTSFVSFLFLSLVLLCLLSFLFTGQHVTRFPSSHNSYLVSAVLLRERAKWNLCTCESRSSFSTQHSR